MNCHSDESNKPNYQEAVIEELSNHVLYEYYIKWLRSIPSHLRKHACSFEDWLVFLVALTSYKKTLSERFILGNDEYKELSDLISSAPYILTITTLKAMELCSGCKTHYQTICREYEYVETNASFTISTESSCMCCIHSDNDPFKSFARFSPKSEDPKH